MNKQLFLGMLKSKTINTNVALIVLITWISTLTGISVPPEVATAIVAIMNIALRFFTNKSLSEKGVKVPDPQYVKNITKAISEDEESILEIYNAMKGIVNRKQVGHVEQ